MASSYLAKRDGGWREAAIIQTRVYGREVRLSRQEVGVIGPEGHSTVGRGQPVKGISHMPLVGEGIIRATVCELAATQGRDPCTHVMPDSRKGAIECSIMIGGLTRHSSNMWHAAVATKAARRLGEGHRIYVRVRRVGCQDSQACARNGRVKVGKGVVAEARGHSTQKVTQARPDAKGV